MALTVSMPLPVQVIILSLSSPDRRSRPVAAGKAGQLQLPDGQIKSRPTAVARWANQRAGTTAFVEAEDVNTVDFIEKIVIYEPELIVVVAFGQKIGNQLIELPTTAAINVHASLLPKYRGAAPVNWVVINGERQTG
ncbi:MAG: formyltransferase family protein, partial [Planctomycetota bacterium]